MTTRTYTARMLEKVSFTQLFNSIIIKKKFQVCQKKNVSQEVCQKESKGGLCMQCVSQWSDVNVEPGQHFDIDIGAVDVVAVIDDEGTAVLVVEAVEAVEAIEAVEVER